MVDNAIQKQEQLLNAINEDTEYVKIDMVDNMKNTQRTYATTGIVHTQDAINIVADTLAKLMVSATIITMRRARRLNVSDTIDNTITYFYELSASISGYYTHAKNEVLSYFAYDDPRNDDEEFYII